MSRKLTLSSLVLIVIVVGIFDVIVLQIKLRSTSSAEDTSIKYNNENDKWLKLLTYSSFANWYPRVQNEIKDSNLNECVSQIQHSFYENVTEKLLKKMMNNCFLNGFIGKTGLFNITLIKEIVPNFSCPSTKFLGIPRPLVALASYPGSGNTWTRELIEALTGTFTGSIYTDWNFKGSDVCPSSGKIYIVKTHIPGDDATSHDKCRKVGVIKLNYTKAILMLRNPYHALMAEFNRQQSLMLDGNPGVGIALKGVFKTLRWEEFVREESETWKNMAIYWLTQFRKPVYVLVYDDLLKYTSIELFQLSRFLNIPTTFNSLYCLSGKGVGNFKRYKPKWLKVETLYNTRLRTVVNRKIRSVLEAYEIPQLYSYILSEC